MTAMEQAVGIVGAGLITAALFFGITLLTDWGVLRGLSWWSAAALLTDRPGRRATEVLHLPLWAADQAPILEHRTEESARFVATDLQPILQGGES